MTGELWAWIAAVCLSLAAAVFLYQHRRISKLGRALDNAEQRLALLSQIAPPLTHAALESTRQTCERIVERLMLLIGARRILCLLDVDGRMTVGAARGSLHYLRPGSAYAGQSIVDWVVRNQCAAVAGPRAYDVPVDLALIDLFGKANATAFARPIAGSSDRAWALCVPLLLHPAPGTQVAVTGALYLERGYEKPFSEQDLRIALMTAALASDALARARFADDVKREAEIDPLTQLMSANAFRKRLREEVERRRGAQTNRDLALFFIDTDRFKLWNDTFGHAVGDTLLKKLAAILRDIASSGGFAGRNGGDEFCIALLDRTKDDALVVAERLRSRVENTDFMASSDQVPQPRIPITVSIGVAHFPVDVPPGAPAPADRLLEVADARMYDAKRDGRNRVAFSRAHPIQV